MGSRIIHEVRSGMMSRNQGMLGNEINYGIKTGYNAAFIIDNQTKEALVAEDSTSAEILKPVLRGRDVQRYQAEWAGLWLIDSHNGFNGRDAVDIGDYLAVKAHLDKSYARLAKRHDKGRTPYNLRNCAYHEDFTKEKLFWMQMTGPGRFAYSNDEMFANAKVFIVTGQSLKYLCGVLNSRLAAWFMSHTGVTTGMGLMQWQGNTVQRIPVPRVSTETERPLVEIVDCILEAKSNTPMVNIADMEAELDRHVFSLYGLDEYEIQETKRIF